MNILGKKCHLNQVRTDLDQIRNNLKPYLTKFFLSDLVVIPMNEPKENLTNLRCDYCYSFYFEQGYTRRMIESLQDFINTNTIQKVYFVLNGNDEDHKRTASFVASNLKLIEANRPAYLTYYSFHQGKSVIFDLKKTCPFLLLFFYFMTFFSLFV